MPSNTASARPEIFYRIGSTDTQYDIIAAGTPDDGDCIESGTGNDDEKQYTCRYTVKSTDSGSFAVKVGTNTTDKAGNALSSAYTHATTLTLDNTVPTVSTVLVDGDDIDGNDVGECVRGKRAGCRGLHDCRRRDADGETRLAVLRIALSARMTRSR